MMKAIHRIKSNAVQKREKERKMWNGEGLL
jgi:hypothetical protein